MRNIRSMNNFRPGIREGIPAWSKAMRWVVHHSSFVKAYDALASYTIAPDKRQMAIAGPTFVGKRTTMAELDVRPAESAVADACTLVASLL